MSTDTRAELNTEVIQNILDGNNRTTAAQLRYVLNRMIISLFNLSDDVGLLSGGTFKGTWNNSTPYLSGDYVYNGVMAYVAINDNTNSEPGFGMDWDIRGVDESNYGPGWAFSTFAPTQGPVYAEIESFKTAVSNFYLKIDGRNAMGGELNMGMNDISNLEYIRAANGYFATVFIADSGGRGIQVVQQSDPVNGYGFEFDAKGTLVPNNRLSCSSNVNTGALSRMDLYASGLYTNANWIDNGNEVSIDPNLRKLNANDSTDVAQWSSPTSGIVYSSDFSAGYTARSLVDKSYVDSKGVISGSYSGTGAATTTFTVTIGATQANATYKVTASPSNALSTALFYINNKTTTTFDVVYLTGLTGAVAFDWILSH